MTAARQIYAIVRKDLLLELRAREQVTGMAVFALLTLVTFNFAFDLTGADRAASGSGALWVAIIFAGLLGMGRAAAIDRQQGAWEGVLLSPVDRGTIFLGKLASALLFIGIVEALALAVFAALFSLPVLHPMVLLVVCLGTVGFGTLGTLFSVMAATTRAREVMLPVLLFPLSLPIVISAVRATTLLLTDRQAEVGPWISLLLGFDVLFLGISYVVFGHAVEE
ncbi:heme exporter protein CcmB [Thermomicrobiaceae bacterium CFH 74404]|uniref:Heme exporter protein CcmB n=1 Tax=Thermalbibacter longus TaxID=2951981 RepID=A0AA41WGJ0_9BACT|nr:heme exporter protein CcmB [Thermalbibacter longus]MCM8750189.1 heme exporter protein CcmB [Thermalbibacter longus]